MIFWLAEMPEELSRAARTAIASERKGGQLAISDITLWELSMMLHRKRVSSTADAVEFLRAVESRVAVVPITPAIAAQAVRFSPAFPGDPQDRIIAATALVCNAPLLTRDKRIQASGEVPCIW